MKKLFIILISVVLLTIYVPLEASNAITGTSPSTVGGGAGTWTYYMDNYDYSIGDMSTVRAKSTITAGLVSAAWPSTSSCYTQIYYLSIQGHDGC
jgi:hypothetical protein